MSTIHQTALIAGRNARKDNRAMERCVKASPKFRAVKPELITIVGHA